MLASDLFTATPWPGLIAWIALYLSDYFLTLTCARLYRAGLDKKIAMEGSFELNAYFQKDIDGLRAVSPRFVWALLLTSLWLVVVWAALRAIVPSHL